MWPPVRALQWLVNNTHAGHWPRGDAFDALHGNTAIHHPIFYHHIIGDVVGDLDQGYIPCRTHKMPMNMGLDKPAFFYKSKPGRRNHLDLGDDTTRRQHNLRRQGCPPDPAGTITPGDPGRRPYHVRNPHPAIGGHMGPAAVVKGCPSPFPIGDPGPPVIRIYPSPIRIGLPLGRNLLWAPHLTILRCHHPGAIGR